MSEEQSDLNILSQSDFKEQESSVQTETTEENPYLTELQKLQSAIADHNKKMLEWKAPGFNRAIRQYRRNKNYVARASRRYNRLRAKGKNV